MKTIEQDEEFINYAKKVLKYITTNQELLLLEKVTTIKNLFLHKGIVEDYINSHTPKEFAELLLKTDISEL